MLVLLPGTAGVLASQMTELVLKKIGKYFGVVDGSAARRPCAGYSGSSSNPATSVSCRFGPWSPGPVAGIERYDNFHAVGTPAGQ